MASDSSRNRLPFEPKKKRRDTNKSSSTTPAPSTSQGKKEAKSSQNRTKEAKSARSRSSADTGIPEVVSQRMLKRMLTFSGVPTALGIAIFFVSYFLIIQDIVDLPSYFVLFSTLGCFGLGVLGLSYGALSASWDETRPGHWFGFDEFKVNFNRMTEAWRSRTNNNSINR